MSRFKGISILRPLIAAAGLCGMACPGWPAADSPPGTAAAAIRAPQAEVLSLEQCLHLAMEKNHRRPASQFEVAMAEAQHRQALAGYWPQIGVKAGYQRLDQPFNFMFPASIMQIPAQSVTVPGATAVVTVPANAFAPGFPPTALQMPVAYPSQTLNTPAQNFAVPQQDVKVLDRDLLSGNMNLTWLLFDGGMRKGLREQSAGWLDMMRQEARRTDLDITDAVTRFYWGAVLATQVRQIGEDTLARMEATLRLTETMYKEGAGKVTKADYLDNLIMVESLRSMVALLEKNQTMSGAALANASGLRWDANIEPGDREIPFHRQAVSLDDLVGASYRFSPDWNKLESAIRAAEGALATAKSGYYPKIALTGELHRWWNGGYNGGISTLQNREGWTVGLGIEFPLFDGLLTRNKISEAGARLKQLQETRFLLAEGLGLEIRDIVTGLDAASKACESTGSAMKSAQENRDLYERAYQNDLVDTEKVIRAQLVEALMSAQHYKARFDYVSLTSQLNLVVGTEVRETLKAAAK